MTTGAEAQVYFNTADDIPADWFEEFRAGHIIVAPADPQRRHRLSAGIAVFAPDTEQPAPAGGLPPMVWENLVKVLAEMQYGYQEFRFHHAGVRSQPTSYEVATAIARYHDRLAELREAADEEDIEWSETSERDFRAFVTDNPGWRKAALGLMDNGNLRAVWKGDDGGHLGLQFLGNQFGEYVIFKQRSAEGPVSRVSGVDTLQGVVAQVGVFNLDEMVTQ